MSYYRGIYDTIYRSYLCAIIKVTNLLYYHISLK
nr:MAG TPA: hypothetical protein [Crassvirales sp.]